MKKRIVLAFVAMLTLAGVSPALADDEGYAAYPPGSERCQELGDDSAGDNDDNGLAVADFVSEVIDENSDCDNSGGRRP